MTRVVGRQSLKFESTPYIIGSVGVVGQKEGEGPLGSFFDVVEEDSMLGKNTWEEAESELQKKAAKLVIEKANIEANDIRYLFGGDLLSQLIATFFGIMDLKIPCFGVYAACSTSAEALLLAAMTVQGGYGDTTLAITSSHFASAEKQFRFPLEYAGQRPLAATWTVTGSGAFIVAKERKNKENAVCITGATPGRIVDYGFKDSLNMGACMAPAACDTIVNHLKDFQRTPEDYDYIITGDLGSVGQTILIDLVEKEGFDIKEKHLDCGILIYDEESQDTHSGGSGCGCSAVVLASYILPKLISGEWNRVLYLPTGALLSTVSHNEGQSVPGIAHGIVLEHC